MQSELSSDPFDEVVTSTQVTGNELRPTGKVRRSASADMDIDKKCCQGWRKLV